MNLSRLALLASLLAAAPLGARVFESYDACVERYGAPKGKKPTAIGSTAVFIRNGVRVEVEFRERTAVAVTYSKEPNPMKVNEDLKFDTEEVDALLKANGGELAWASPSLDGAGGGRWQTKGKELSARLIEGLYLRVEDGAEPARQEKDSRTRSKNGRRDLSGF